MLFKNLAAICLLVSCAGAASAQDTMDGTLVPAVDRSWVPVSDSLLTAAGGQILMERSDGIDVVRLTNDPVATGSLGQGGTPGMRTFLTTPPGAASEGIAFRLRGTVGQWQVRLRTDANVLPRQFYQASFEAGGDWQAVTILFADFQAASDRVPQRLNQGSIRAVELVADTGGIVDLQLADIGIY